VGLEADDADESREGEASHSCDQRKFAGEGKLAACGFEQAAIAGQALRGSRRTFAGGFGQETQARQVLKPVCVRYEIRRGGYGDRVGSRADFFKRFTQKRRAFRIDSGAERGGGVVVFGGVAAVSG